VKQRMLLALREKFSTFTHVDNPARVWRICVITRGEAAASCYIAGYLLLYDCF
jgi:hypothetical protein